MSKYCLLQEGNFQLKSRISFEAERGRPSGAPAAAAQGRSDEPAVTDVTSARAGPEAGLGTEMSLLGAGQSSQHRRVIAQRVSPVCASTRVTVSLCSTVGRAPSPDRKLGFQTNS